jgi:hypothetical protein
MASGDHVFEPAVVRHRLAPVSLAFSDRANTYPSLPVN